MSNSTSSSTKWCGPAEVKSYYKLRPAFNKSILHALFTTDEKEELACADQMLLRIEKKNLLDVRLVYNVAHSRQYRAWYLLFSILFITVTITAYSTTIFNNAPTTAVIVFGCCLGLVASLTRIDLSLMRALMQTFEWPYLLFVFFSFVVLHAFTQQQVDSHGWLRAEQWSGEQINGFIQAVSFMAPMFTLSNLDAIPFYQMTVKLVTLIVAQSVIFHTLAVDMINYATGDTSSVAHQLAPRLCVGEWMCTSVQSMRNLFAGQVSFFLMHHIYISIYSMYSGRWNAMTILNVPLIIHPHFEEEKEKEETLPVPPPTKTDSRSSYIVNDENENNNNNQCGPPTPISAWQETPLNSTCVAGNNSICMNVATTTTTSTQPTVAPDTPLDSNTVTTTVTTATLPPIAIAINIDTARHCVDHRTATTTTTTTTRSASSTFAFEVGGYATSLQSNSTTSNDAMPWVFPIGFRPINPFRSVRRWIWHRRAVLQTRLLAAFVCNTLLVALVALLCARDELPFGRHPLSMVYMASSLLLMTVVGVVMGTTVSDASVAYYLLFRFEFWLTFYQICYVLLTQFLMPTRWFQGLVVVMWLLVNLQVLLFDAAIWYDATCKRALLGVAFLLGVLIVVLDAMTRTDAQLESQNTCYFTCTNLHVSSTFTLVQSLIFGCKYMFALTRKNPRGTLVLSIPTQYIGESDAQQQYQVGSATTA